MITPTFITSQTCNPQRPSCWVCHAASSRLQAEKRHKVVFKTTNYSSLLRYSSIAKTYLHLNLFGRLCLYDGLERASNLSGTANTFPCDLSRVGCCCFISTVRISSADVGQAHGALVLGPCSKTRWLHSRWWSSPLAFSSPRLCTRSTKACGARFLPTSIAACKVFGVRMRCISCLTGD